MKYLLLLCVCVSLWAQDWPRWRGTNMDGTVPEEVYSFPEKFQLKVAWKKSLGSGYSSISVADNLVVTMFSDGKNDYIVALDCNNGEEKWRYTIDSAYLGHDGSHDGPISTPVVAENVVYALGAKGNLVAVQLQNGKKIWETHLVNDHKFKIPFYGYATSPVLVEDVLVIESGESKAVSGFDKKTGKLLWSTGEDSTNYQSPIAREFYGTQQILSASDMKLYAVQASTGNALWEYEHGGKGGTINPVVVGRNKLFLQHKGSESILLEIDYQEEAYQVKELWTSRDIKGTFNTSVYNKGYLYGYSSRFLTCVDGKTGKKTWKSREPGDGFLILVGQHLVIITKKGQLHIVKANSEDYAEVASLKLFKDLSWSPPSFANGSIYIRSLGEIAKIDAVAGESQAIQETEKTLTQGTEFGKFLDKLKDSQDKSATLDEFLKSQQQFPIVEGNLVHFVYRGEAEDVALVGDISGFRSDIAMQRAPETDFFYYTAELTDDARVSYKFSVNYDKQIIDPLNDRKNNITFGGEHSWLAMPKWTDSDHLKTPEKLRGTMETLEWQAEGYEEKRKLEVYLPQGYDKASEKYPVLYIHWGEVANSLGKVHHSLDNLIGDKITPVIAVFIHSLSPREYQRDQEKYSQMFTKQLIPFIENKYRAQATPAGRVNMGVSDPGTLAMYITWQNPELFGKAAFQTPFVLELNEKELRKMIAANPKKDLQVFLSWGKYDLRSPLDGWDLRKTNSSLMGFLKEQGYTCFGGEYNDGFGWTNWSTHTDEILLSFFALPQKGDK